MMAPQLAMTMVVKAVELSHLCNHSVLELALAVVPSALGCSASLSG